MNKDFDNEPILFLFVVSDGFCTIHDLVYLRFIYLSYLDSVVQEMHLYTLKAMPK